MRSCEVTCIELADLFWIRILQLSLIQGLHRLGWNVSSVVLEADRIFENELRHSLRIGSCEANREHSACRVSEYGRFVDLQLVEQASGIGSQHVEAIYDVRFARLSPADLIRHHDAVALAR